ncbi:bi-domain-containing oxidoreductase [Candidatus Poribacteria bacterium]|nr:bi-domain-containing oxidoreductase [Candidatus Poribacteria bacterium]
MQKNIRRRANLTTEEVPVPRCGRGNVLIANRYSLISAGTETAAVRRNKKDMVVKAMTNPELRQSVKDMLLKEGIKKTADRVQFEMTKWTPLGYSGAGVAIEVGQEVEGIQEGNLVAYGGEGHAEFIRVAKNLCVGIPGEVSAKEAAFVALGSIAMQAVRQAEVQVGDVAAVLGLGLVGQLVSQMLQVSGARVLASDVIPQRIELATSLGAEHGFPSGELLPEDLLRYTGGIGVDRVVICASTASNVVIEQAMQMSRDRGRIVVVGAVGMDVPRDPFYHKELELRISRSYGPGRYDPMYEEHGVDYPIGYVRWTEKRNMGEFLRLLQAKKVNVIPLISHEFALDEVERAYEVLMTQPGSCLAILLRYDETPPPLQRKVVITQYAIRNTQYTSRPNIAVIGCGAFARQFHLPYVKASRDLNLRALVTSSGQNAKEMGGRYGAEYCATDYQEVLNDEGVDAVMVLTRDNSHAGITLEALKAGKHVFCEKPLATTYEACGQIANALRGGSPLCMVGFNRRFAPLIRQVKESLKARSGPCMLHYRINAGPLPKESWVYDPAYSAGRIVGEACHFVDLFYYLIDAEPVSVFAQSMGESPSLTGLEDITATFQFTDGSVATLLYTAIGTKAFPKERIELFAEGSVIVLDDYSHLTVRGKKRLDHRNRRTDKGHTAELDHFVQALRGKVPLAVTHLDGIRATICCLKIFESVKTGKAVAIELNPFLS